MPQDITLKLPSGINAPTQDDINAAKEYVLERSRAEIALASTVDDILKEYVEQMIRVCYKYNIDPQDFSFGANDSMRQEIYTILDDLLEELLSLIEEDSVPQKRKNKHYGAIISWLVTLGTHNKDLKWTTQYYISRFSKDVEALVASMKYAGYDVNKAVNRSKSILHTLYTSPEILAAMKSGKMFNAEGIISGGTKYDPFTHKPSVGLSKYGATNLVTMARSTLAKAWMKSLFLEKEEDGMTGYYVFRGSTYPCPNICDMQTGWFHPMSGGMVLPMHSNCYCYAVFVIEDIGEIDNYRPLTFR